MRLLLLLLQHRSVEIENALTRSPLQDRQYDTGRAPTLNFYRDIYVVVVVLGRENSMTHSVRAQPWTQKEQQTTRHARPARNTSYAALHLASCNPLPIPLDARETTPLQQRPSTTEITDGVECSRAERVNRVLKG